MREQYRGHCIRYLPHGLSSARAAIDRLWAKKICDAPDAKARAEILAEERCLTASKQIKQTRRHKNQPANEEEEVG
jgi:hypothetical protein